MNLYMKQRIFCWGDKFSIYDEAGNECYHVEGEVFTFGKKLHLYDGNHIEQAFVKQRFLNFPPKYEVLKDGMHVTDVVKEFTFFRQEYTVNAFGWKVHGNFLSHDYEITDGTSTIASVSKKWFVLGDAYEIAISNDANAVLVLAIVLVIDAFLEAASNSNNN